MKTKRVSWPIFGLAIMLSACEPSQSSQAASSGSSPSKVTDTFPPGAKVELTRNIYLVLDGSSSMSGKKFEDAKKAVTNYLSGIGDDVNLGLWIFDSDGNKERVPLGAGNKGKILAAIKAASANYGTPLGSSITAGAEKLHAQYLKQLGYGEFFLLVITDGEANVSDPVGPAVKLAARYGIPLFTIGYQLSSEHELKRFSAAYREATDSQGLEKALADILPEK